VYIISGGKILHNPSSGSYYGMDFTYANFLKNVDLQGRQADLGDLMSIKGSIDNADGLESVVIMATLASQFIYDLEDKGIIPRDMNLRKKFLSCLAEGFAGNNTSKWDFPEPMPLRQLSYDLKEIEPLPGRKIISLCEIIPQRF